MEWWKDAVVYQIYPKSFMDSSGDGIGDINGITEKLPYIRELGADVIWLSPIYDSPQDDNGYDIRNYYTLLKEAGSMEDFDRLLLKAHELDIRIIMDLVVNHTSDEHVWFQESRKSKDNPYRDFYIWKEGKERSSPEGRNGLGNGKEENEGWEPNNWGSCYSGSAWAWDGTTKEYYLHLFSKKQPDLNWDNVQVREEIYKMMLWWLDKGIDGFRMDVISLISKLPGYPDGETKEDGYTSFEVTANGPHVHEYLKEMNKKVLSRYDVMTVGECSGATLEDVCKYAGYEEDELNMVFQFELMGLDCENGVKWDLKPLDFVCLKKTFEKWQTGLYGKAWNSLFWNNHDQPRIVTRWGNGSGEYRELSAKMLATMLYGMQGTPFIYQGEELGMTNPELSIEDSRDIETLRMYQDRLKMGYSGEEIMRSVHAKCRDNARTPMQWDDSPTTGFSSGKPWMPVNPDYKSINARAQLADKNSVFHYYQKLIKLRKTYNVFRDGGFTLEHRDDPDLMWYTRTGEKEKLLVICNFHAQQREVELPMSALCGRMLICNYPEIEKETVLRPYEARMYLSNE